METIASKMEKNYLKVLVSAGRAPRGTESCSSLAAVAVAQFAKTAAVVAAVVAEGDEERKINPV